MEVDRRMIEYQSLETATSGSIRFNTDSSKLEIYNGEAWFEIDATSPEQQTGGTRGIRLVEVIHLLQIEDRIEFLNVDTTGNAIDFGNLTDERTEVWVLVQTEQEQYFLEESNPVIQIH